MASLTRDQLNKWSAALADGWKFDAQRYIMWSEKQTYTDGPADENGVFYRVTLSYYEERTGSGWLARSTGKQLPTVRIDRWKPTQPDSPLFNVVEIFRETVGEKQSKRNYNYLAKLTDSIDVADLLTRAAEQDTGKLYNDLSTLITDSDDAEPEQPEEEPDDFSDIDVDAVRAALESGEPSAFVAQVMQDVERIAAEEAAEMETERYDACTPYHIPANNPPETVHSEFPGYMMSDYTDPAKYAREATEEAQDAPEGEQKPDSAQTDAAQEDAQTAGPAPDMFATLAAAYIAGRTVKPASKPTTEPEPEPAQDQTEPEPEDETPAAPGYAANDNNLLPESTRASLLRGETVTQSESFYSTLYYSAPYSDRVRLVYSMTVHSRENPAPGSDFKYYGFMIDADLYAHGNQRRIIEKYREDVNRRLIEMLPSESDAAHAAANVADWERRRIEDVKMMDYTSSAQQLFYRDDRPAMHLYGANDPDADRLIDYLLDPLAEIDRAALEYLCADPAKIYCRMIEYNRTLEAYERITADPSNAEHTAKRIGKSITDQQTVRIELANGHEVKAEASAVKNLPFCGYISPWHVTASDRELLNKNEYGRAEDIHAADIVAIRHGQRTLYIA